MKDILELIMVVTKLVTPNPEMKGIRLKRKELRLAKKKLRIAEKMFKQIKKEFKKDGFTDEELDKLAELQDKITARKESFI